MRTATRSPDELLQEWHWKEQRASQPETLKYLNYVADKYELRRTSSFTLVSSPPVDNEKRRWA